MDPCSICEGTFYHLQEGMNFCAICGTKYEGALEMEADTDENVSVFNRTRIKQKKKKELVTKEVIVNNKYELLQLVLQQQVEALIKLGANPQLKDVVFRIWAKYLERHEEAFYDLKTNSTKSTKKKMGKKHKVKEQTQASSSLKENLQGKSPYAQFEETSMGGLNFEDENDEMEEDKAAPGYGCVKYDYTLAFCYLGLMFTNPLTMVSDLIRWVKEYKVPFLEGADCIPDSYTLSPLDKAKYLHSSFHLLNPMKVLMKCTKILRVVEIQDFPEVSLVQLIKKYIILLNLPDEMHCLAGRLVESRGFQMHKNSYKSDQIPFLEGTAVSYIIVMLKMIFGLDYKTERELSCCTRELMKLTKYKHQLFVFDDWMKSMKLRVAYNFRRSMAMTTAQGTQADDGLENLFKGNRSRSQRALGPLDTLSMIWKKGQTGEQTDDGKDLKDLMEENTVLESDFLKNMQHFRKSSIQHILHPEGFTNKLDKFNLADVTIDELLHSCKSHEKIEPECNFPYQTVYLTNCVKHVSDEMVNEENSDFNNDGRNNLELAEVNSELPHRDTNYHPARKRLKVAKESSIEKEPRLSLRDFLVSNISVTEITNQEQFNLVCRQIQAISDTSHVHYEMAHHSKSLSYINLLKICCNLIDTEPQVLHGAVVKTEHLVFVEKDKE